MNKILLLTFAAVMSVLGSSAPAQNLLINGDFETGSLAPWVGGTIVPDADGGFSANTVGSLSQTVATTPGKQYLVAGDVFISSTFTTSGSLTATPAGGGVADGSRIISAPAPVPAEVRASLFFTASTASTTITFSFTPFPGFPGSMTVDNVVMMEAAPSKLAGTYSGTNLVTLQLTNPELANKSSRKVTAQITAENQIFILDGAQAILSGVILNDGSFELNAGFGTPQGAGTAKIQGKRIELQFTAGTLLATDSKGLPIANTITNKIVLNKK